ncbi:MAG: 23S rRNA (pseudouridine(1915)-N(3))-methyltransferase RlmH [Candidatus Cloacimonetes bacterium]|nr:23S rRNA (pseudouridine(1915)-N(3))-methyltransferase RlmH [Candidatus Cloacimonadota bacterium]
MHDFGFGIHALKMNIKIIQLGKDKDNWLKEAIAEYTKRLQPFCKLEIYQLQDVSIKDTGNVNAVIEQEAQLVLAKIKPTDFMILLDEKGTEKTSLEFAEFLISISYIKHIVFVIGGVYGSSVLLKKSAKLCLSLSRLTFTHRMSRLILIEQIYRAMMISHGRRYHIE